MTKTDRAEQERLRVIYEQVVGNQNSVEVIEPTEGDGNMGVSSRNMYSRGYGPCDGVVILGNGVAGLSHYVNFPCKCWNERRGENKTFTPPEDYLTEMADKVRMLTNNNGLTAVVLNSDSGCPNSKKSLDLIKGTLKRLEIPLVGEYFDRDGLYFKDLVVIPSEKKVILFYDIPGNPNYVRLTQ